MIEHPRRAGSIIRTSPRRAARLIAMMLGGEDFALEAGSVPGDETSSCPSAGRLRGARAGVPMIGILGTVADYSDPAAYRKRRARRLGFSGGTCIHPGLVTALNEAFTPKPEDVAQARKMIEADERRRGRGRGSFSVDGKMIDIPVDRARRMLAIHDAIRSVKRAKPNQRDLPEYELFAIRYATREARRADHFIGGDPHDGPMPMDYFVWVAKGAEAALMIDTGFTAEIAERGRSYLRYPIEALKLLGIDADTVEDVIITHLHYDHVGNFHRFPAARFHLQEPEMHYATGRYMRYPRLAIPSRWRMWSAWCGSTSRTRVVFHDGGAELAPGITLHPAAATRWGCNSCGEDAARLGRAGVRRHAFLREPGPAGRSPPRSTSAHAGSLRQAARHAPTPQHIVPGHDPLVMKFYPARARAGRHCRAARRDARRRGAEQDQDRERCHAARQRTAQTGVPTVSMLGSRRTISEGRRTNVSISLSRRRFLPLHRASGAAAARGARRAPRARRAASSSASCSPSPARLSYSGQQGRIGATIAIEEINAAGGIKSLGGAKIEPVLGDAQSTPEGGTAEVEKMNSAGVRGHRRRLCLLDLPRGQPGRRALRPALHRRRRRRRPHRHAAGSRTPSASAPASASSPRRRWTTSSPSTTPPASRPRR